MVLAGMKFALGMTVGLFMAATVILGFVAMLELALELRRRLQPDSPQQRGLETQVATARNRQPFVVSYPRTMLIPSEPVLRRTERL